MKNRSIKIFFTSLCSLLLVATNLVVYSQDHDWDSLYTIVSSGTTDRLKTEAWNQLSKKSFDLGAYDSALVQAHKALEYAQKSRYINGLAKANSNIANVYLMQSQFKKAIYYNQISLQLYQQLHNEKGQCKVFSNLGIVYFQLNSYPKALHSFLEALKIDLKSNDSIGLAQDYRDIGMVKSALKLPKEALSYYYKALHIQEELNDQSNMAITLSNIALIYTLLNQNKEAIHDYQRAIAIFENEKNSDNYGLSYCFNGLGIAYKNLGIYEKAMDSYQKSLAIKRKYHDKSGIADVYNNIGRLYLLENKISIGKKWLYKALEIAEENKVQRVLMLTHLNLSSADSLSGNFKGALAHYQQAMTYKDSIFNDENKNKIDHLQMDYEFSQREDSLKMISQKKIALKEAAIATQKREKWFLAAGILLLGIIGTLLFYQNKAHKRNNRRLAILNEKLDRKAAQNLLLTKEMHHRIKNNLFMVYSLLNIQEHNSHNVETQNHLSAARQRIESIASLHEQLYNRNPGKINLEEYLTTFLNHVQQQFAHNRLLRIHTNLDKDIKIEAFLCMPIAMLLNEWLTNSVKYAATDFIYLDIFLNGNLSEDQDLVLEYHDNGLTKENMKKNMANSATASGIGSQIIYLLCKQIKGELDSKYMNQAYHYLLKIPLKYE